MSDIPLSISTRDQIIHLLYISNITPQQFKSVLRQVINYLQMLNGANHKIPCNQIELTKLQKQLADFIAITLKFPVTINQYMYIQPKNETINLLRDWIEVPSNKSQCQYFDLID